jgi:hypothetical protein
MRAELLYFGVFSVYGGLAVCPRATAENTRKGGRPPSRPPNEKQQNPPSLLTMGGQTARPPIHRGQTAKKPSDDLAVYLAVCPSRPPHRDAGSRTQSLGGRLPTTRTHINPMASNPTQGGQLGQPRRYQKCSTQEGRFAAHGSGAHTAFARTVDIGAGCSSARAPALTRGKASPRGFASALAAVTQRYRSPAARASEHCSLITAPLQTTCRSHNYAADCGAGHYREHRETRGAKTRDGLPSITSHDNAKHDSACGTSFRWYPCFPSGFIRPHYPTQRRQGLDEIELVQGLAAQIVRLLPDLVPASPWLTAAEAGCPPGVEGDWEP